MFTIEIYDRETKKLIWTESHSKRQEREDAIQLLKERNFNPDYFEYKLIDS
ncbi:hypothetical protein [Paraliobacillus sp. X-1268]|uniref:hypothetical protein n=1 Tax=Paraliobacillus sp. X-1268 TaxID=2213193 RepID=UPI0013005E3C|nr:hypothetical protein [Paraliobacillus sp. X-1268]